MIHLIPIKQEKARAFRRWLWVRACWWFDAVVLGFALGITINMTTGGIILC